MIDEVVVQQEILALAQTLIRLPTVTVGAPPNFEMLRAALDLVAGFLEEHGLETQRLDQGPYPALVGAFPGGLQAPVMLVGHLDVVASEPDERQFRPYIEGDYLFGRGAADMKTAVATILVWMKHACRRGAPFPAINLLLVTNEERGEDQPMGTPHVLQRLALENQGYAPRLVIAAERTEESGTRLVGDICTQNRGVMRFRLEAHGARGHSAVVDPANDLVSRLVTARQRVWQLATECLTLSAQDGWCSQLRFPFIEAGVRDVYNITPDEGVFGVEVRAIPGEDLQAFYTRLQAMCDVWELEIRDLVMHPGVACEPHNPYLQALIQAVGQVSGAPPRLGRKLAGTSARFAPHGQGVVWGQSGLGPHAADERHFIPSIMPYFRALDNFAMRLVGLGEETPARPTP